MPGRKIYIVIPARLRSSRLPRKLLLSDTGKSVLQHTYEGACDAKLVDYIGIATSDDEVAEAAVAFGAKVWWTPQKCHTGTERVITVAQNLTRADIVVNLQADEPEIDGRAIDQAIQLLVDRPAVGMSTLAAPIDDECQWRNRNRVKVVCDEKDRALLFSRSPIPYAADFAAANRACRHAFLQHIGLYAFRREFLLLIESLPPHPIERIEGLEQLRILVAGHTILVGKVATPTVAVDSYEDYQEFVRRFRATQATCQRSVAIGSQNADNQSRDAIDISHAL